MKASPTISLSDIFHFLLQSTPVLKVGNIEVTQEGYSLPVTQWNEQVSIDITEKIKERESEFYSFLHSIQLNSPRFPFQVTIHSD